MGNKNKCRRKFTKLMSMLLKLKVIKQPREYGSWVAEMSYANRRGRWKRGM